MFRDPFIIYTGGGAEYRASHKFSKFSNGEGERPAFEKHQIQWGVSYFFSSLSLVFSLLLSATPHFSSCGTTAATSPPSTHIVY